jgi:hypothetical protein
MSRPVLSLLSLLPLLLAFPSEGRAQEAEKPRYDRNRITLEEVTTKATDAKTAYDVVRRLRPQFLRSRPSGSVQNRAPVAIKVFVDGGFRGGLNVLNEIQAHNVIEINYLNGSDATTRFGTGYESGAILVTTGRR